MVAIDVAVIRASHLGGLLCAIPAIRALRLAGPGSRIVLIGLPWAQEFCARYPHYFDGFMEFPGWPGVPECPPSGPRMAAFQSQIERSFDIVLQLHDDGAEMSDFAATIPSRVHAGFVPADTFEVPPFHVRYPDGLAEPLRLLAGIAPLGLETIDVSLELPVFETDRQEAHALLAATGFARQPYAVIHPGSLGDDRRWPVAHFAAVANALASRGLQIVVTGDAAERPLIDAFTAQLSTPAADVGGRASLGGLAALVDGAQVVVTNDNGVSHVAAARGTRSVVVFVGSDPARWAPLDRSRHVALGAGGGDAVPTPADVIHAAMALAGATA